jgi:hypothetical protein
MFEIPSYTERRGWWLHPVHISEGLTSTDKVKGSNLLPETGYRDSDSRFPWSLQENVSVVST